MESKNFAVEVKAVQGLKSTRQKYFWGENISIVKNILRSNIFLVSIIFLGSKIFFWLKTISLTQKYFLGQNYFLGSKFFLRSKYFWVKNVFRGH